MPVSLFLDWYEVPSGVFTELQFSQSGWDVFESTDAVMVLAGAAALLLVVTAPRYIGRGLLLAGALPAALILIGLVEKPGLYGIADVPGLSVEIGAWLGLTGALLIVLGGGLGTRRTVAYRSTGG